MADDVQTSAPPPEPPRLAPVPDRIELEMRTDWGAQMIRLPGSGVLAYGIALPGMPAPAAVCTGTDPAGASWVASRLNRAAFLENSLTALLSSLALVLQLHPDGGISALELYVKTHNLLVLGQQLAESVDGAGATKEGEG